MRVFVYEYLTALGLGGDPADPLHPMYREGRAMRDAVAGDFGRVPGVRVVTLDGAAPEAERDGFRDAVRRSEWSVVVAPEFEQILESRCWWVEEDGGSLLGPASEVVRLAADKLALAEHWRERGVPTPATTDREPTACEAFPVVWKPRDGAGSTATFRLEAPLDVARAKAQLAAEGHAGPMILQQFVPGRAASVALLCGPAGHIPLVPCLQHLSDDGRFKYLGGELPIPPDLAERAARLATRAVGGVPGLIGYVGVDLVLGDAADGSADYAIEVNPRLTTSYVGLRALAEFNLAGAMLRVAQGAPPGETPWKPGRVRFGPDGAVAPTFPAAAPGP
jgi:predicted ATP-grasp superfamily ATP-dependent carboligase